MSNGELYQCEECGLVSCLPTSVKQTHGFVCGDCEEPRGWVMVGIDPDSTHLLDEAKEVVEDRENRHGSIIETHSAIADLLEVFMRHKYGVEIEASAGDAADLLDMCLKDARKLTGETDRDTYRDGVGYNYCGWICREAELEEEVDD